MTTTARRELIRLGLLLLGIGLVYHQILADLVHAWIVDGNYSHGFFIAPIAAYFVWERRDDLAATPVRPSAWGLVLVVGSLVVLAAGLLGSEFFLSRISLIGVLGGSVIQLYGWRHFRIVAFPLAFLLLMIPIPVILFNQVALPLQFLASRFGEFVIDACGIPVFREGNVLTLANTSLEVAEACSGIRSLVSLMALGLVFAYFADRRFWVRAVIVASTIPVAVITNGARVAGTGVLAHAIGPEAAQGFFHEFSGWLVFVFAALLIFGLQLLLARFWPDRTPPPARPVAPVSGPHGASMARTIALAVTLCLGLVVGARAARNEDTPSREAFTAFPMQVGDWRGIPDAPFSADILAVLGLTDYMTRLYVTPSRSAVDLYVGYWQSQRQGESIHSPLNCLPGAGWEPVSQSTLALADPRQPTGPPIEVNRYVIQKGIDRQLVIYWYQSHGRVTASEYRSKLYLMEDAVRLNRTDGAIVRVIAPIRGDTPAAEQAAQSVATRFVTAIMPQLDGFLPN